MMAVDEQCCSKFDPNIWQKAEVCWKEKISIKDYLAQIIHILLVGSFGKGIGGMGEKIEKVNPRTVTKDQLILSQKPSS